MHIHLPYCVNQIKLSEIQKFEEKTMKYIFVNQISIFNIYRHQWYLYNTRNNRFKKRIRQKTTIQMYFQDKKLYIRQNNKHDLNLIWFLGVWKYLRRKGLIENVIQFLCIWCLWIWEEICLRMCTAGIIIKLEYSSQVPNCFLQSY